MSIYFPNRDELSFRSVLALPKAKWQKIIISLHTTKLIFTHFVQNTTLPSSTGFDSRICCSIQECCPLTAAKNWRISFVLSVFPAPDSPLKTTKLHKKVEITHFGIFPSLSGNSYTHLIRMHWSCLYRFMLVKALSPIAKMCGDNSPIFLSR